MKLFLYSLNISHEQCLALNKLVGKDFKDISFGVIENATDVVPNSEGWVGEIRESLRHEGYQIEQIDLRNWMNNREALTEKLKHKDVIWLGGGNTFYLRWILKETGADDIITDLVRQGKVYAGWSAGAVVAGPTLKFFDGMDDVKDAPEVIWDGLHLTDIVFVPHADNELFATEAKKANEQLKRAGFNALILADNQAIVIDGEARTII
jgi:dipeptidase E